MSTVALKSSWLTYNNSVASNCYSFSPVLPPKSINLPHHYPLPILLCFNTSGKTSAAHNFSCPHPSLPQDHFPSCLLSFFHILLRSITFSLFLCSRTPPAHQYYYYYYLAQSQSPLHASASSSLVSPA